MRTYLAEIARPGMPPARYRVAFHDHEPRAMAVTRITQSAKSRPIAISDRSAQAAIAAALLQMPDPSPTRERADPTAPYAALASLARAPGQRKVA